MGESENIMQLKRLIDDLDKQDELSDEYHNTLKEIRSIINSEECVINNLKNPNTKIKHYQNVCKNILSIISTTNI